MNDNNKNTQIFNLIKYDPKVILKYSSFLRPKTVLLNYISWDLYDQK